MSQRNTFASKIGLIAATVGSAVGLGNIWRFPAEAQANGGAAFLLLYALCVILLGIPVMVSEFALGRAGKSDAIGVFANLKAKPAWKVVGGVAILTSYLILCFYMVVAGWTLEYLWESVTGSLYAGIGSGEEMHGTFAAHMNSYITNDWQPLLATTVVIVINIGVLMIGVQKGIERLSNILMPMLFVILLVFCGVALTLPDAAVGVKFFLSPDFSKITPTVFLNALGQAFFSLSLGMGILITYASYYPKDTKLTRTAGIVAVLSTLVAVLMGLIIFPAVTSFGLQNESLEGSTLVFVTLPEVFAAMPGTQLWSILFFLLLFVAALTSTISIAEVSVAFVHDRLGWSRIKSVLVVLLPLLVFSSVCSLSQGTLSDIHIFGFNIFDFLDFFATNILLPLGAIGVCIYMGWFAPRGLFDRQLTNDHTLHSPTAPALLFIVRYIAPALIFLILLGNFL